MVVGLQGLSAGIAHMHANNIVDQDLHAGNVMESLDGSRWVKGDLGSAVYTSMNGVPNKLDICM